MKGHGLLLVPLMLLLACGKEAGRVPFTGEGRGEANVQLEAGQVSFWTDIDVDYEGSAGMQYQVALLQDGAPAGSAVCDPLGTLPVKMTWVETDFNDSHSRRGKGKLTCSVDLAHGGPTTVRTQLVVTQRPARFVLRRADLILKQ